MRELIHEFPKQLKESLLLADNYTINLPRTPNNIVICGLGGSGIGGEIIKQWTLTQSLIPIAVCQNYQLPHYINENTLIITCSYSGNTEETLHSFEDALNRNAMIIGITSGGKLKTLLGSNEFQCIIIPGGLPPRAALAYPLVQLANIFDQISRSTSNLKAQISSSISLLLKEQNEIINIAAKILAESADKKLLFYAEEQFKPTLIRACQQINENGKMLGFYNILPEMNHNEIVGWANDPKDIFVVFVRSNLEFSQNSLRLDLTENVIRNRTKSIIQITAKGENLIEQSLFLIHVFDWLSLLIAEKKDIDITEVHVIDQLKLELSKVRIK